MSFPMPEITEVTRPYWDGLAAGVLRYQRCNACGNAYLPPRDRCPGCLSDRIEWPVSAGRGRIVSWVVYHKSYAAHLDHRIPYNVAIVALDEGPRLLTNIIDAPDGKGLSTGARVALSIETEEGLALARFRLAPDLE